MGKSTKAFLGVFASMAIVAGVSVSSHTSSLAASAIIAMDDCDPPILDVAISDAYACTVDGYVHDGHDYECACELALADFGVGADDEQCLAHTVDFFYCDAQGRLRRVVRRFSSNCFEELFAGAGCSGVICPTGTSSNDPACQLTLCPLGERVMLTFSLAATCLGGSSSAPAVCVWMSPRSSTPSWGPCDGAETCECLDALKDGCTHVTIQCRNTASPGTPQERCPSCAP